jgi:hypothetical protein
MQPRLSLPKLREIENTNREAARRARTPELKAAHTATADIAQHMVTELLAWLWQQGYSADSDMARAFGVQPSPGNICRIAERPSGDYLIIRKHRNGPFIKLVKRTGYYGD